MLDSQFLSKNFHFLKQKKLLLACSGGVDSVCLFYLLLEAGFTFEVAHCNFQLRGSESDADQSFLENLCKTHHVKLHERAFETESLARQNKWGIQEAARNLRYAWFTALLSETQSQYVLLAHNADDQIETSLFNFFRGTGLKGLCAMSAQREVYIRPLLTWHRSEIKDYMLRHNYPWREDSSNVKTDYARNYIRHEILPQVVERFPEAKQNVFATILRLQESELLYRASVEKIIKRLISWRNNDCYIAINYLNKQLAKQSVLFEFLHDYGFSSAQMSEVLELTKCESGKVVLSREWRLIKHGDFLILTKQQTNQSGFIQVDEKTTEVETFDFYLHFEQHASSPAIKNDTSLAYLNADAIAYPLIIRKWKLGDYFYPLGMKKKKKVSRFMIDAKLPLHEKEKVWVMESGGKIVWVIGQRIDDRYKITSNHQATLLVQLKKK